MSVYIIMQISQLFKSYRGLRKSLSGLNILRQNGHHFSDDIFKSIFLNENVLIFIEISFKFVPRDPINYIPALVQIMAWPPTRWQAIIWTNDS